ncbi:MAG TPA: hypothetical protein VFL46_09055 [Phycicoccus sp.]|nr:hypothetical protein [Phycicoccus sp.]
MRRTLVAALGAGLLVGASAGSAGAAEPRIYHTITDTTAYAEVSQVDTSGCIETSLWVTSSAAMYTGKPSGLNTQDRTTVDLVVRDLCASAPDGVVTAAAGPGVVVFQASGETAVAPVVDTRLTTATVSADFLGQDGVPISVDVTWSGTGELTRSHVVVHDGTEEGNVSSTATEVRREARAEVSAGVGGYDVIATTEAASLSTIRFRCVEVPRPGVEEYYPCFGFPG